MSEACSSPWARPHSWRSWARRRRIRDRTPCAPRARFAFWRAVRAGAALLAVGVVAVGIVGLVAFDAAFEVFHRLFFAGGTYTFDPRTDRLVQLFPQRFWFETSVAVGVVILVLCAGTAWLAGRRLRADVPPFAAPRTSLGVARR